MRIVTIAKKDGSQDCEREEAMMESQAKPATEIEKSLLSFVRALA